MRKTCSLAASVTMLLCLILAPAATFAAEASGTVTSADDGILVLNDDASVAYAITDDTQMVGAEDSVGLVGKSVVVTFDENANPPVASRVEVVES